MRRYIDIIAEASWVYYHCSSTELPVGMVISGRGSDYERDWAHVPFYQALEQHRPSSKLAHSEAVFMVSHEDDLDSAEGDTLYVFTLRPLGSVERHDMNWTSRISSLIDDGFDYNSSEIKDAATRYWAGEPSDDPRWEYLTLKAEIINVEEY